MKHFKVVFVFLFTIFCTLTAFAGGTDSIPNIIWTKVVPKPAALSFAPDDSYIVTLDGNGVLRFYTVNNCDTITSIFAQDYGDDGFHTLNFSNDGKYLLTNSGKRYYQFDAKTFKLIKTFGDTTDIYLKDAFNPGLITFSSDGQYAAMVSTYYNYEETYDSIMVYDINTGKKVKTIVLPITDAANGQRAVGITAIGFTLDNQYLLVNGYRIYNQGKFEYTSSTEFAYDAKTLEILKIANIPWLGTKMSKDWSIGVKHNGSTITIFKYPSNETIRIIAYSAYSPDLHFDFSSDNKYLIVTNEMGFMSIYNINDGNIIAYYTGNGYENLAISKSDKYIFTHVSYYALLLQTPWTNTSTQDQMVKDNILYPNPSTGNITLNINLNEDQDLSLIIIDENGNIKLNKNTGFINSGSQSIQLNVNDLSNGAYFCKVTGKSFSQTFKFQINK